jgi:MFS transporter, DHA2 family, multidrug resistance protein
MEENCMQQTGISHAPAGKWMIVGTVILGSFMSSLDTRIIGVALPQMLGTFAVSLDAITWVAVSYSIGTIILTTMAGWCSSLLGRKRFYMLSFLLFTAASALCGLARSLEMMVLARLLQGIGGGGLVPVAQSIILDTFPERERGTAMGVYLMGVQVAGMVGPTLGGWLTDTYGWPWIFYINVPVGVVGLYLATTVLTDPPYMRRHIAFFDFIGIGLLTLSLTTLQLVLVWGEDEGWWASPFIVWLTLGTLGALAALVWWELRVDEPVVNLRLLRHGSFLAGTTLSFVFGFFLYGSPFLLPLFLQKVRGYAVLDSGLVLLPQAVATALLAPFAGRLAAHVGPRLLIGSGMALMLLGFFDQAHLSLEVGSRQMLLPLLFTGAGMAVMLTVLTTATARTVPLPLMTAASSIFLMARRLGGNVGYAVLANQLTHRTALHRAYLREHVVLDHESATQALENLTSRLASAGLSLGQDEDSALKLLNNTANRHAAVLAHNDVFRLLGMLFVLSLPLLYLLGRQPRRVAPALAQPTPQRA